MAWTAPVIPKLQNLKETPLDHVITVSQASWIISAYIISSLAGPYIAGPISNKIGRKYCLIIGESATIVATLILTFANTYVMLLIAKIMGGVSNGIIVVTDLVYIGEIASPNIRGMLLTSTVMFQSFGILLGYCIGPFASYKTLAIISMLLSLLHLFGCIFIPESQMYYAIKGRKAKARATLRGLRQSRDVEIELENIMETINKQDEETTSYREIFTVKSNRKAFLIIVILFLIQECSGILAVLHFSTTIFQFANSSIDPDVATIIVGVTQFLATLLSLILVDKLGRKSLLLFSTGFCTICMALLGVYFYLNDHNNSAVSPIGWLPLVLVMMFYAGYGSGINVIPNTIVGEMFNARVRSRGSALTMTIGWAAGLISVTVFGYAVDAFGGFVMFFAFAFINCLGFVFTYFVVPETRGMTLVEIEKMLAQ